MRTRVVALGSGTDSFHYCLLGRSPGGVAADVGVRADWGLLWKSRSAAAVGVTRRCATPGIFWRPDAAPDRLRGPRPCLRCAAACPHLRADRIDFHLGLQPSGHDTGWCGHAGAEREREDAREHDGLPRRFAAQPSALPARCRDPVGRPEAPHAAGGRAGSWVIGTDWFHYRLLGQSPCAGWRAT